MPEPVEDAGRAAVVAVAAEPGEGLLVMADSTVVLTGVVVDVAHGVQGGCRAVGVVVAAEQGEGCFAMVTGGVEVAESGGVPAHGVEDAGFPDRLVEGVEEVPGVGDMLQRPLVVGPKFPGP